uniref:Regulator of G protein signaling 4 n=1 Tax=Neogobius melanostomus TaxID=47308 RepID=A0A8C6UWN0_9GOBI
MCKGLSQLPATCLKGAKDIKHKISHLLQKPEPQTPETKPSKDKTSTAAKKKVPTAADVEKWRQSFSHLLKSDVGRAVFSTYLRSEFSEENLKFWEACEEYKRSPLSQLQSRAKQIYQRFIEADAPNEVNLDALTRDLTKENLEEACPTCFDEAQKMIHILMEKDSYRRFLSSALLKELCQPKDTQGGGEGERAGGA